MSEPQSSLLLKKQLAGKFSVHWIISFLWQWFGFERQIRLSKQSLTSAGRIYNIFMKNKRRVIAEVGPDKKLV